MKLPFFHFDLLSTLLPNVFNPPRFLSTILLSTILILTNFHFIFAERGEIFVPGSFLRCLRLCRLAPKSKVTKLRLTHLKKALESLNVEHQFVLLWGEKEKKTSLESFCVWRTRGKYLRGRKNSRFLVSLRRSEGKDANFFGEKLEENF